MQIDKAGTEAVTLEDVPPPTEECDAEAESEDEQHFRLGQGSRHMSRRSVLCVSTERQSELRRRLVAAGWDAVMVPHLQTAACTLRHRRFAVGLLVLSAEDDASWVRAGDLLDQHSDVTWVAALQPASLKRPACLEVVLNRLFDHHCLPFDYPRLLMTLGHAFGRAMLRYGDDRRSDQRTATAFIGDSQAARSMLAQIRRVAVVDAPVLLLGESGSGKEVAAQAVHRHSPRRDGPFVAVSCAALQSSLSQSQLAGATPGSAPTGNDLRGLIEAASGGTIFLDEVSDLPLELQTGLLSVLPERVIHHTAVTQGNPVNVRVMAATHMDLEAAIRAGRFRNDLYYRLGVLPLQVPSLRERQDDIVPLALHFYEQHAHERRPGLRGFSRAALAAMQAHHWPGNVRELINRVRRAMVMTEGRLIRPQGLGLGELLPPVAEELDSARVAAEHQAVLTSLRRAGGNVTQAAKELGISRMTLYRLMTKHGISGPVSRRGSAEEPPSTSA